MNGKAFLRNLGATDGEPDHIFLKSGLGLKSPLKMTKREGPLKAFTDALGLPEPQA